MSLFPFGSALLQHRFHSMAKYPPEVTLVVGVYEAAFEYVNIEKFANLNESFIFVLQ
jgi:hypothetical protein